MKINIGPYPKHRWYHNFLYKLGIENKQKTSVHIDDFDTWSMDHTLAYIIEPMLKQLKFTTHGAPYVDPEDVPADLRPTKKELTLYTKTGDCDPKFFERWDWVLDEMIFAFESKHNDWEEQFYTPDVDWVERTKYQDRITHGFKLFGKYYENLWD